MRDAGFIFFYANYQLALLHLNSFNIPHSILICLLNRKWRTIPYVYNAVTGSCYNISKDLTSLLKVSGTALLNAFCGVKLQVLLCSLSLR